MEWVEIIRAEEDTIGCDVLDWADARELWDEYYEKTQNFSILHDIISKCPSAEVILQEYDFDLPGRSGVEYVIETSNPDLLKKEIKNAINDIIQTVQVDHITSQVPSATISQEEVIDFLMRQAVAARAVRLPAGYQGMAEVTGRAFELVANTLSSGYYDKCQISFLLTELLEKIYGESFKSGLKKIIENLQNES